MMSEKTNLKNPVGVAAVIEDANLRMSGRP